MRSSKVLAVTTDQPHSFCSLLGVLLKACCLSVDAFDVLNHDEGAWPFDKAVVYPVSQLNFGCRKIPLTHPLFTDGKGQPQ